MSYMSPKSSEGLPLPVSILIYNPLSVESAGRLYNALGGDASKSTNLLAPPHLEGTNADLVYNNDLKDQDLYFQMPELSKIIIPIYAEDLGDEARFSGLMGSINALVEAHPEKKVTVLGMGLTRENMGKINAKLSESLNLIFINESEVDVKDNLRKALAKSGALRLIAIEPAPAAGGAGRRAVSSRVMGVAAPAVAPKVEKTGDALVTSYLAELKEVVDDPRTKSEFKQAMIEALNEAVVNDRKLTEGERAGVLDEIAKALAPTDVLVMSLDKLLSVESFIKRIGEIKAGTEIYAKKVAALRPLLLDANENLTKGRWTQKEFDDFGAKYGEAVQVIHAAKEVRDKAIIAETLLAAAATAPAAGGAGRVPSSRVLGVSAPAPVAARPAAAPKAQGGDFELGQLRTEPWRPSAAAARAKSGGVPAPEGSSGLYTKGSHPFLDTTSRAPAPALGHTLRK